MVAEPSSPRTAAWFRPTRWQLVFAAVLATVSFFLPQAVPLEWYPLNEPGDDVFYLEITCASNVTGNAQILYDVGRKGHRPIDTISWPISPTAQPFTYTFPLPDAPIVEMRVIPPTGGELTIKQMRIVNRRDEEIRRFTYDLFRTQRDIAAIAPITDGWKLIATADGKAPSTRIELFSPIIPAGMNHRNLLRCLLSTGYLAMMLFILLLAVLFTFYRPAGWRDLLIHGGFMALLALMFALVGNRGLIRNSVHFARYPAPVTLPGLHLEFDLCSSDSSPTQLFWDVGRGMNGDDSDRRNYEPHAKLQTLRFNLPTTQLRALRYDPRDNPGSIRIRGIRVVDQGMRTRAVLPLNSLQPERETARLEVSSDQLIFESTPKASDPILNFTESALILINRAIAADQVRQTAIP